MQFSVTGEVDQDENDTQSVCDSDADSGMGANARWLSGEVTPGAVN